MFLDLGERKGQAQPLAAALATATTVLYRLMVMLLIGAVAVACTVFALGWSCGRGHGICATAVAA
jgi:hypothetical protein